MSYLDALIYGVRELVNSAGAAMARRSRIKFVGATLADDEANDLTLVTVTGGGSPLPVATVANSVLQRSFPPGTDPAFFAPMTLDQILSAYAVTLIYSTPLVEVSQSVATPAFTASYARPPAAAVLTDTIPTTPQSVIGTPNAFASTGTFVNNSYGQSVTFTLTANETGGPSKTSTQTITWGQKVYYGNAVPGTPNAAFIAALPTGVLALSRTRTFSATAGATERIYYAIRSAYGTPTFTVGGFVGGFHLAAAGVSVTNAHGFTENYDLYESDNLNLGATTVVVT